MLFAFSGRATRNFLSLVVVMHFILFVDRVNLAAAASVMQQDLGLSNIALGIAFSAFNYAYAPFQLIGGWFADRFGARRTLTVCGVTWSITTIATGAVTGLVSLFAVRLGARHGRGCDVAGRYPCAIEMDLSRRARHRGRYHPRRRTSRRGGVGADRRLADHLVLVAFLVCGTRRCVGFVGCGVVVVFLRGSAPAPAHHQRRARRIASH